ncbi:MAG: GlsB/YeaQ/YmgE family stress response membrane protein [candidate division NC10 bacterium]|nr:GlsB/YeaQ/YmgE family stress response membrane protein [candidate division NC10 bacterium]
MLHLLGQALFGLVVGALAKLIFPGKDPGGVIVTALMGLIGSLLGTVLGRAFWGGAGYSAGWIASILGTIVLLALYRAVTKRQTT